MERALELNPSSADILAMSSGPTAHLGKPEQGAAQCDKAYRLNAAPRRSIRRFAMRATFLPNGTERRSRRRSVLAMGVGPRRERGHGLSRLPRRRGSEAGATDDASASIVEWKRRYPDSLPVEVYLTFYTAYARQQGPDSSPPPSKRPAHRCAFRRPACRHPEAPSPENLRRGARQARSPMIGWGRAARKDDHPRSSLRNSGRASGSAFIPPAPPARRRAWCATSAASWSRSQGRCRIIAKRPLFANGSIVLRSSFLFYSVGCPPSTAGMPRKGGEA